MNSHQRALEANPLDDETLGFSPFLGVVNPSRENPAENLLLDFSVHFFDPQPCFEFAVQKSAPYDFSCQKSEQAFFRDVELQVHVGTLVRLGEFDDQFETFVRNVLDAHSFHEIRASFGLDQLSWKQAFEPGRFSSVVCHITPLIRILGF